MSRVHRYEQIEAQSSSVVDQQAFEYGVRIAYDKFRQLEEQGLLVSAFFYGSAIFNGTNTNSDIDTFVVVHQFDDETTAELRAVVAKVKIETNIPLSLTAYTIDDLVSGMHWERDGKIEYLRQLIKDSPELLIGLNPLDFLQPLDK